MKNKNKLLLSLLASLAVATTGHAQKNDAPELSPLSVVGSNADAPTLSSGLKSSLPISSIPQSISVMGSDQMKAQGMKSIGDVLDFTPGVINSQGEGHRDAPIEEFVPLKTSTATVFVTMCSIIALSIMSKELKSYADQTLCFPVLVVLMV